MRLTAAAATMKRTFLKNTLNIWGLRILKITKE